jgi:hypothetical protein
LPGFLPEIHQIKAIAAENNTFNTEYIFGGIVMSLKVIGTGFGRTGTDSMREALEILGFGPCHHMRELIKDPAHERL